MSDGTSHRCLKGDDNHLKEGGLERVTQCQRCSLVNLGKDGLYSSSATVPTFAVAPARGTGKRKFCPFPVHP